MRRAANRMRLKIENLAQELHRQTARFLVEQLRCDTAARLRDIGDGGAWQAQDQKSKTVRNLLSSGALPVQALPSGTRLREAGAIVLECERSLHDPRLSHGLGRCWRTLAAHPWSSLRTASEWTATIMERVGYTCARWEISGL